MNDDAFGYFFAENEEIQSSIDFFSRNFSSLVIKKRLKLTFVL